MKRWTLRAGPRSFGLGLSLIVAGCATAPSRPHPRAEALQAAGVEALGRGELESAAGNFALALEYDPHLAEAESGLGLVALRRGDLGRAEEDFRAALALNEDLAEAHVNLAGLLMRRDDDESALGEARAALAIDPGYADARLLAGELLLRLGRTSDAHWELEKLCAAHPRRADAHAANALVLARLGRPVAAGEQADLALAIDPNLPAGHRARAEILRRNGELEEATREIELAIAANPGSVEDRLVRATILAARGMWDEAAAALGDSGGRSASSTGGPVRDGLRGAQPRTGGSGGARRRRRTRSPRALSGGASGPRRGAAAAGPRRGGPPRAGTIPRRGAADDGGRARSGCANPGQRSAIESPPMPLRLRLLPAPSPATGPAQVAGPREERAIELADETNEVRIGRRPDLELPLPYPALSGLHARLVRIDGRWQIEDLGSTNGTRVDGERLVPRQPRPIAPGAQIKLGQITLAFDGTVGAVAGAERTATIARRLVNDLFSASSDMATPSLSIVGGVPARPPLRLEATDRRYVAGRGETCDLQLASEEISREHVEIFRRWDGVVVNDLGSKNGLRVNDVLLIERRRVRDGDLIQIGPATLRLSDPADRYLREFEARAPQVPRTEDENAPAPATAASEESAAVAEHANPEGAEMAMVAAGAVPAPAGAVAPLTPAPTGASRRPGGSRTAMIVAAVVLVAVGAVIVVLAFGG